MRIFKFYLLLGLLISFYLIIPGPKLPPPDLPESVKSTEPGDTIQLPRISAYYTNLPRSEVINFYRNYFSRSSWFGLPLPTYRLNHPPEEVKTVIRETTRSWFLEELVHPWRESLFINGYDGQVLINNRLSDEKRIKFLLDGKEWNSKITLRWFPSKLVARLVIFWLAWGLGWLILKSWRQEILDG